MYNLKDEVLYLNRTVYVVGVRQPTRYESERHYDLARKSGKAKPDFRNVPEHHLRKPAPIIEKAQVLEFRK